MANILLAGGSLRFWTVKFNPAANRQERRTKEMIIKTYDQLFDAEDKEANHD